jgi:hypothetical protein
MRVLWAGLFVLLVSTSGALAQATGFVRGVGFAGAYRADCWTPLLVHLDSTVGEQAEYQIQVHQQDLDRDTVVFTRTVSLGPQNAGGHQDFWVYFLPQPTDGGLTPRNAYGTLGDVLKVHLYDKAGKTHVAAVPVQGRADEVEQAGNGNASDRGAKLVLVVIGDQARYSDEYPEAQGVSEAVRFVPVRPGDLPDHVLGYEAVDAVLWLTSDWAAFGAGPGFAALQQWVRQGGHLAVCQPSDRSQLDPLANADMLPVVARTGAGPAAASAIRLRQKTGVDHVSNVISASAPGGFSLAVWDALQKSGRTFEVADAVARPDAMVDAWVTWAPAAAGRAEERSPFIVRRAYGMGAVTWVGQNLGSADVLVGPNPDFDPATDDPNQKSKTSTTNGWPRFWDRVFGWQNATRTAGELKRMEARRDPTLPDYAPGTAVDLGQGLASGTEFKGRSAGYVLIAILFFIAYWVVAGPGSYLYLAGRKRKGLSWTVFGASAVGATLLTVLLVKLLLGGGPEVKHVSVVRLYADGASADGTPRFAADVRSRVGLYIPKDGSQRVALPPPGPERVAAVAPYAVPPGWLRDKDAGFTDTARYVVDTDPMLTGKGSAADFFFRSTMKKVQGRWAGPTAEGVTGAAELLPPVAGGPEKLIGGQLTNKTGRDLRDVHLVFTYGQADANANPGRRASTDRVLFVAAWDDKTTIDLGKEWLLAKSIAGSNARDEARVSGAVDPSGRGAWTKEWYKDLPTGFSADAYEDSSRDRYLTVFPLLSLFDRVGPARRKQESEGRAEPGRRGFRDLDVSPLVAAGKLVILARAGKAPVAVPLEVNGDKVAGEGTTFYQIALPLSREKLAAPPPTTAPATGPATQKAEGEGQ